MASSLSHCAALFGLLAGGLAAMPPAGTAPVYLPAPPSDVALYQQILAANRGRQGRSFVDALALSDAAFRLWQRTGDTAYRSESLAYLDQGLSDPRFSLDDFHLLHHFGELLARLKQAGLIPEKYRSRLIELARSQLAAFCKSPDNADNNIRVGTVAGYAGLLRFLEGEDFPERAAAQRRLDAYWELIRTTGDLDEDAQNYDSLGAAFLVDLARLMGREQDLKAPGFRRFFARFRDITSPAGLVPEYGDSYFSYTGLLLDRIYLMEYAARLYDDPTFLYAARKLRDRPCASLPGPDTWTRSLALIDLPPCTLTPRPPDGPPSVVTYRRNRLSPDPVADKLILRSGLEPGSAMVMMDLYAAGSHSHPLKGPSIAYYEADQVPLFHNMGRHQTRSAITGNILWAMPPGQRFPGCWNREGEWFTMRIPVELLNRDAQGRYVIGDHLTLRNFPERNHGCKLLCLDNLRLEGPAGVRLIDSFDDAAGWGKSLARATTITDTPDKTQGAAAQKVAWAAVPSGAFRRSFPTPLPEPFTRAQYTHLCLDLKYEGARPYMHIRDLGEQIDLGDQALDARLAGATVEQRGQDAYGRVSYAAYVTPDTTMVRQIVLTAEGCLVVRDQITPGPSMEGWTAGQLWQFYAVAGRGPDWLCAEDDGAYPLLGAHGTAAQARRMLVRFAQSAQAETVRQDYYQPNPRGRKPQSFCTAFSARQIHAGRKETFALAVLPHDPKAGTPEDVARRVSVSLLPDGSAEVAVTPAGAARRVLVRVGDGHWSVERGK